MDKLHRLKNGLRVYIDPMPSLETAAIGVWAQAGSVDEQDNEHGVAHLLEHMAFKGTSRRSARDIAEEIENIGGYLNAATSHQRTGYYARVLKDDIETGLDVLADILQDPLFDEAELAKEKEVVVQEIGEAADTPDDVVFEMLQEATWDGHTLARPILGTPDTVRAQTPGSLRGFMGRHYCADTMVIAVAGRVEVDTFLPMAEKYFSDIPIAQSKESRSAPGFVGGSRHDDRDIEQTHMALALPGVSSRHEDFFATRIFADALGGGMSSRLFQTIREERGLAYSVYAFADSYDDCGLVGAYVGADATQVTAAAKLIREAIEDMSTTVTQGEIDRVRAMLRASLMMSLESPAARIESAPGQLFTFGKILTPDYVTEQLDAVTLDDIRRCAARALGGPHSVAIVGAGDAAKIAAIFA